MNDIGVGAVGAALIAGVVSVLGLVIGKEQKVSEFRQAWIDDLRQCLVAYLANINAITDAVRMRKSGKEIEDSALIELYKSLNEANHGITLRINSNEPTAQALLASMTNFEAIAGDNANFTPEKIKAVETAFIQASKDLLKFEWKRVKTGEPIFVLAKRIGIGSIILMIGAAILLWNTREKGESKTDGRDVYVQMVQSTPPAQPCPAAPEVKPSPLEPKKIGIVRRSATRAAAPSCLAGAQKPEPSVSTVP